MMESSMDYWWPLAAESPLRTPLTYKLNLREGVNLMALMDGWPNRLEELFDDDACGIITKVKEYPAFLRSDQMAAKHSWKHTCYVTSPQDVLHHSYGITEECFMADHPASSFYLRDLIPTNTAFPAFAGQLPITTEVRTFLRDGQVDCMHPYWPIESVAQWADRRIIREYEDAGISPSPERQKQYEGLPRNWKQKMRKQHQVLEDERNVLMRMAGKLASYMKEKSHITYWSADLLRDKYGRWWLTDMASGIESFHWEGCKKAVQWTDMSDESNRLLHETKREMKD